MTDIDDIAVEITGDEDVTAPPAASLALARHIYSARFEILTRCGHWTPLERPFELSGILINFLFASAA